MYICSEHFSLDDFIEPRALEFGKRMMLKPDSVPSIHPSIPDHPIARILKYAVTPECMYLLVIL